MTLEVVPATPDRWPDVVEVMRDRGDPARCFCQYFRLRGKEWSGTSPTAKRDALGAQVASDRPPGVLATDAGTPVGWCAVAPRSAYPRVVTSPNWRGGDPDAWVVTCFVVPVGHRRQGLAGELLHGAIDFARAQGTVVLEACAVDLSYTGRVPSADLYRGPLSVYLEAGFTEVSRTSARWVLVSKAL